MTPKISVINGTLLKAFLKSHNTEYRHSVFYR